MQKIIAINFTVDDTFPHTYRGRLGLGFQLKLFVLLNSLPRTFCGWLATGP